MMVELLDLLLDAMIASEGRDIDTLDFYDFDGASIVTLIDMLS